MINDPSDQNRPHCITNFTDLSQIAVYEQAIKATGVDLWIDEPSDRAPPNSGWRGLWARGRYVDLSDFWDEVKRIRKTAP